MKLSCATAVAIGLGLAAQPISAQSTADGEVLNVPQAWEIEEVPQPAADEEQPQADAEVEFFRSVEVDDRGEEAAGAESTIIDRKIASWKDPLTLPHSRMECVKWAYPWPGAKICIGHKYQFQWMYCEARLIITGPSIDGIGGAVNDCLQTGAAVAAVAGIVAASGTGGAALPAAKAAFVATFEGCVAAKVGSAAIGVNVPQNCTWGPWE